MSPADRGPSERSWGGQARLGLLAGLTGAALYVSGMMGGAAGAGLAAFAPLPLFMAALGWGLPAGAVAGLFAGLLVALAMSLMGVPAIGLAFALSLVLPVVWLCRLALLRRPIDRADPGSPVEWYPLSRLLLWIAGLAIAALLAGEAVSRIATGAGLPASFAGFVDSLVPADVRPALTERVPGADWPTLRTAIASAIPAVAGLSWQITLLANLSVASAILSRAQRNQRPGLGWRSLTLPRALAPCLLFCLLLGLMIPSAGYLAGTIGTQLFVPYFFLGLTVVHAIPVAGPGRVLLLGLFYFLMLSFVWPALAVGALGLSEQWFGLRARLGARAGRED